MAELTAATPGTSGGDRPVGHWGWENFFVLESVAATFVATRPTMCAVPTNRVLWVLVRIIVLSSHLRNLRNLGTSLPPITDPEVSTDPQRILTALFK